MKAGLAAAVALGIDHLTGNPDHVSSTFIAVVCVSPVVLIGLERARDQVLGSAIGGTCGTLAVLAGAPLELGIPVAVAVGVSICFAAGFGGGYLLASFAALFVQAVPFGLPATTLGIRALAVGTGATAGLLVNVTVSAFAYRSIFRRRLRYAEGAVAGLLQRAVVEGPAVAREGFPYILTLCHELDRVRRELAWRRRPLDWVDRIRDRLDQMQRLLHLLVDLDDLRRCHNVPISEVTDHLVVLLHGRDGAESSALPETFTPTLDRLTVLMTECFATDTETT